MRNRKVLFAVSVVIMAVSAFLTYLMPEKKFFHMFFHMALLAVVLLSVVFAFKDLFIIVLLFSSSVWVLGFFEVVSGINQLLVETAVLLLISAGLGWYEMTFKIERSKIETILDYKKKEIKAQSDGFARLKKKNTEYTNEIKKYREFFK